MCKIIKNTYCLFSLTQTTTTTEQNKVVLSNVIPELDNNDLGTVCQKSIETVDEEIVQNNTFTSNIPRDPSIDSLDEAAMQYNMISIAQINSEECGVPMSIFDNVDIHNLIFL
jgi:hypothetical protein